MESIDLAYMFSVPGRHWEDLARDPRSALAHLRRQFQSDGLESPNHRSLGRQRASEGSRLRGAGPVFSD